MQFRSRLQICPVHHRHLPGYLFDLECKSSSQYVILYAKRPNGAHGCCLFVVIARGQKKGRHYEGTFGDNSFELLAHSGKLIINHA